MSSPIGGFMPIPLAMMMPFMAAQSMLMGDAFGKGFQFGKRKISALSNEEFNQLDMSAMVSNMQTEFKNLVPTLQQSIRDSKQVQNVIIDEMIKIVPEFLKFMTTTAITTATTGITQTAEEIAHALGGHAISHETASAPTSTSTTKIYLRYPTTTNTTTRHSMSNIDRNKFLTNNTNVINQLTDKIIAYIPRINLRDSNENVTAFKNGGFPFPDHSVLRGMYLALIQQKQFRFNVLAGNVPY